MPISLSSYDTTFGRRFNIEPIKSALTKATVSNYLNKNEHGEPLVLENTSDIPVDIPAFQHPLFVDKEPARGLYVDARHFVTYSRQTGDKKITSLADYNLLIARGGLEQLWREQPPSVFANMSRLPASVYSSWLSENIRHRFGLQPEDQYKLQIFSAWFYFSLFSNEESPDSNEYMRVVKGISSATNIDVETIMQVLDGQTYVKDVNDFCERLYEVTGAVELKGFGSILLYPILNSTWYSSNSMELVPVAIEHIPSFFALIVSAVSERAYHRSKLSQMIERVPAKNATNDFVLQVTAVLKS